jgi:hypothetical protein
MKKKIIIPVAIATAIAVIIIVIISGNSLSGKYYLVDPGETPVLSQGLFSVTEYLVFKGDTVGFALPGPGGDSWVVEYTYTIKDNIIIIRKDDGSDLLSLDFKKDGGTIYIADSVWKK